MKNRATHPRPAKIAAIPSIPITRAPHDGFRWALMRLTREASGQEPSSSGQHDPDALRCHIRWYLA